MPIASSVSINTPLCEICKGRCCQGSPGIWIDPERFFAHFFGGQQMNLEQLREHLPALGLVLWEKSGVAIPAPRSFESGCAFLTAAGCQLPVATRPCQCLALIPDPQTLDQPQGCLCQESAEFSREAGRLRWESYWLTT